MIKVRNIEKSYSKKGPQILKNINLDIEDSSIVGIIGENGAGKTTLIKVMTGLIIPTSGQVFYDNSLLNQKSSSSIYKDISIVLDGGRSLQWRLTVKDNFLYYSSLKDIERKKAEKNILLYSKYFQITELLNRKVNELSLGQKQIVAIVCMLISESKYIFLDEPTNGLDIETKSNLIKMLKQIRDEIKTTFVITTHDLEFLINVANSCIVIDKGIIIKTLNMDNEKYESCYKYYKESFFEK